MKNILGHVAGVGGLYARTFRSKMTIVTFHRVTDSLPEDGLTCNSEKFATFCDFFRSYFRVLSLSEQVAGCRAGADLGGTLSITFDDGYLNNFEEAAPILKRAGLPATFFVTTGFIGSRTIAPWDRALPRQPGWMNWDQVRTLVSMGFEVGNHTATHLNMGVADAERVRSELVLSSRRLSEELGQPSRLFAYPFGGRAHISATALRLVQEAGFSCCASSCGSLNGITPDPFHLNRVSIAGWFKTPHQFGFEYVAGKLNRDASYPGADQISVT